MEAVEDPIRDSIVATPVANNGATNGVAGNGSPSKRRRRPVLLLVLLVVVIIGGSFAVMSAIHASRYESTDDAYIEGRIINISPQVSALVKEIPAGIDDNRLVRAGDVLVKLDPTDYQVALDQATATLGAMKGKSEQARSEINEAIASRDQAAAEVDVALANSVNALADYNRFVELQKENKGAVSKQQMDSAIAAKQSTDAQVKQAKAKLANADAEIATKQATANAAEGDVKKAVADVHKAEVNLSYCTIRAPEDGKITKKNVEPGDYVQTGEQLLAVVPRDVWWSPTSRKHSWKRCGPVSR
jgi:membrane fusion protein (multidrug efflux system)